MLRGLSRGPGITQLETILSQAIDRNLDKAPKYYKPYGLSIRMFSLKKRASSVQGGFQGLLVGRFPRRGQLATKLACTYHRTEIRKTLCMTLEHNLFCHVRPLSCNAGPKPNTPTTFSTKLRQAPTDLHSGSWSSLVCWKNYFRLRMLALITRASEVVSFTEARLQQR